MDCFIELFDIGHLHPIVKKILLVRKPDLYPGELLDFKTTGSVFLVFLYSGIITMKYKQRDQSLALGCYVLGQVYQENFQICLNDDTEFILIELNPVALGHIVKKPLVYFTDRFTPIHFFGSKTMIKELSKTSESKLKFEDICDFCKYQFPVQKITADKVFRLTQWIDHQNDMIKVDKIADYLNCGERQVERIFQKKIGVSPKFYLKCIQMRQIINMVMEKGNKPLLDILYEKGHYDASHFTKDFKRIMKMTPLEFLRRKTTFDRHIIRLENFRK